MWILMMIVFNQPYEVKYMHSIGHYTKQKQCMVQRNRAIRLINEGGHSPVAFGCIPITIENKTYS